MPDEIARTATAARREPDFEILDPRTLRLFRDGSGWLRMTIEGDRTYLGVNVVRAFPHSDPDHYIGILDARDADKVIGLVENPEDLNADSLRLARDALAGHYFIPTILRLESMKEEYGAVYFDVETDRGRRKFVAKGVRDAIEELPNGEMLVPDVDGNRYRIRDWESLDPKSRALLEGIV